LPAIDELTSVNFDKYQLYFTQAATQSRKRQCATYTCK